MRLALSFILVLGCTKSVDIKNFQGYGVGQPGHGLVHGGQVFFEIIHKPDGDIAQINGWGRTFSPDPAPADSVPIPLIPPMTCQDISTGVFPRTPAAGSMFTDLGPQITVATGTQTITALKKATFTDNLQFGIPSGYQLQPFDPSTVVHEATYTLTFNGSDQLTPNTMFFSPLFQITSPTIGTAPVQISAANGLDITWDPVNQQPPADGLQSPDETFSFAIILGPPCPATATGCTPGQYKAFCPMNDGKVHSTFTIPTSLTSVTASTPGVNTDLGMPGPHPFPAAGTLVFGQQTHMQAKIVSPDGVDRRFDLITIECNRSPFTLTP